MREFIINEEEVIEILKGIYYLTEHCNEFIIKNKEKCDIDNLMYRSAEFEIKYIQYIGMIYLNILPNSDFQWLLHFRNPKGRKYWSPKI